VGRSRRERGLPRQEIRHSSRAASAHTLPHRAQISGAERRVPTASLVLRYSRYSLEKQRQSAAPFALRRQVELGRSIG
jgi:hypothetical protein